MHIHVVYFLLKLGSFCHLFYILLSALNIKDGCHVIKESAKLDLGVDRSLAVPGAGH